MVDKIDKVKKVNGYYNLPQSVKEAARILDQEIPNWASKIDIEKLDLTTCNCIICQLYGTRYTRTLNKLFNISSLFRYPVTGDIFNNNKSKNDWLYEIVLRRNDKTDEVSHDLAWAILRMKEKEGTKVRPTDCSISAEFYLHIKNRQIYTQDGYICNLACIFEEIITSKKWEVYIPEPPKIYLDDLKPGQKFRFVPLVYQKNGNCIKLWGKGAYHNQSYNICHTYSNNQGLEVILID